jgi:pentatricopeptide repeat protein
MVDRIGRVLLCVGFLLGLGSIAPAQERDRAEDRREALLSTYLRTGRYADARRLIDEMLASGMRGDLRSIRAVLASGPNMRVRHAAASFACEVTDRGVWLPATVNGKPVQWLMDTGAGLTIISDAEAIRLGLEIQESEGRASDMAGGSTAVRVAIARRIVIGRTQFEHVPVLITPADRMPWKELAPGRQGILGLPLFIRLDALRWTRAGMCHTGSAARDGRGPARQPPNLEYHRLHVTTRATLDDKTLELVLDTGNGAGTQLYERFAKDFESQVKARGRPGSATVTQIGGSTTHEITVLPAMLLTIGGKETRLAEGKIFPRPVGDPRFHGLLGMDLLSQASEVTIDFRAMVLTLR